MKITAIKEELESQVDKYNSYIMLLKHELQNQDRTQLGPAAPEELDTKPIQEAEIKQVMAIMGNLYDVLEITKVQSKTLWTRYCNRSVKNF